MDQTVHPPYRTYRPRPFTRAERSEVTILFGGLHWRAERLIQGAMENLGYRSRVLPTATKEDLLTGRELADIGQCCPTSFTTGNLANFLRAEAKAIGPGEVAKKYVYVTAGACGACRFGQYHQSYELALRNVGLESFRMFLLAQNGLDQGAAEGGGLAGAEPALHDGRRLGRGGRRPGAGPGIPDAAVRGPSGRNRARRRGEPRVPARKVRPVAHTRPEVEHAAVVPHERLLR
jgi:hypothetical protein